MHHYDRGKRIKLLNSERTHKNNDVLLEGNQEKENFFSISIIRKTEKNSRDETRPNSQKRKIQNSNHSDPKQNLRL